MLDCTDRCLPPAVGRRMALPAQRSGPLEEDDPAETWCRNTLAPAYGKLRFWILSFVVLMVVSVVTVAIRRYAPGWSWLVASLPAGDLAKQCEWLGVGSVVWQVLQAASALNDVVCFGYDKYYKSLKEAWAAVWSCE